MHGRTHARMHTVIGYDTNVYIHAALQHFSIHHISYWMCTRFSMVPTHPYCATLIVHLQTIIHAQRGPTRPPVPAVRPGRAHRGARCGRRGAPSPTRVFASQTPEGRWMRQPFVGIHGLVLLWGIAGLDMRYYCRAIGHDFLCARDGPNTRPQPEDCFALRCPRMGCHAGFCGWRLPRPSFHALPTPFD